MRLYVAFVLLSLAAPTVQKCCGFYNVTHCNGYGGCNPFCFCPYCIKYSKLSNPEDEYSNCTNLVAVDPCLADMETTNIVYDVKPICPNGKDINHTYVIRAVLEDGSQTILDNDMNTLVQYDTAKKMSYYHYATQSANMFVYFTSAVCAVANPRKFTCPELPPAIIGNNTSPVMTDKFGSCPSGMTLWRVFVHNPTEAATVNPATTNIFCQEGKWMLRETRFHYAYTIVGASCAFNNPAPVHLSPPQEIVQASLTTEDPCVTEISKIAYGVAPICPNGKDGNHTYIIRAVLEDGSIKTLHNDMSTMVHYDERKKMHYYHFKGTAATQFVYFTSAVCAVANPGECPCPALPPAIIGNTTSPVITEQFGSCPSGKTLWRVFVYHPTQAQAIDPATTNIQCQAGVWMLRETRFHYAYAILGASCA